MCRVIDIIYMNLIWPKYIYSASTKESHQRTVHHFPAMQFHINEHK